MKAMIFAAGLGTRLKPLTENMPKALVQVAGKPLLAHIIQKLSSSGFTDIIVNVHHFSDQIIDFVNQQDFVNANIAISDEHDQLLDTGGAIQKAKWFLDDGAPFLVHNVDILSNADLGLLYRHHCANDPLATLVGSIRKTSRYLLFDENNELKGWINEKTGETKPPGSELDLRAYQKVAFSGIQVLSPKVFQLMYAFPDRYSIIDFYLHHAGTQPIKAFIPANYHMLDVGKPDSLARAEKFISNL